MEASTALGEQVEDPCVFDLNSNKLLAAHQVGDDPEVLASAQDCVAFMFR